MAIYGKGYLEITTPSIFHIHTNQKWLRRFIDNTWQQIRSRIRRRQPISCADGRILSPVRAGGSILAIVLMLLLLHAVLHGHVTIAHHQTDLIGPSASHFTRAQHYTVLMSTVFLCTVDDDFNTRSYFQLKVWQVFHVTSSTCVRVDASRSCEKIIYTLWLSNVRLLHAVRNGSRIVMHFAFDRCRWCLPDATN